MSIEKAIQQSQMILRNENRLEDMLATIDQEEEADLSTPTPKADDSSFLLGDYTGREEILGNIPCLTFVPKNTPEGESDRGYFIKRHSLHIFIWVAEADIAKLTRYAMRYAEAVTRIISDGDLWQGFSDPQSVNTMYTDVFQADHRLLQGCRIEVAVSEIAPENFEKYSN